jgi:uncharacterized protein (DUF58 family)
MPLPSFRTAVRWIYRNRSLRLTSEGTRFLLFTLAIGVAAINTGNNLFYLVLALMLSLIVVSGLLSEQCLHRLEFQRYVPDLILANDPTTVTLSVTNHSAHVPSFSLRFFDLVAEQEVDRGLFVSHLPAHRSLLLSYPILATQRGWIRLQGLRVETLFPFGLFLKRALYAVEADILVGPAIKPLSLRFIDDLVSEGQGQSLPRRGHGAQLYNLRLYQPGDDSRTIHWMTTARTAQLIVRETEAEDQRRITVILSTVAPNHLDGLFERSVTLVASLLWHLSERAYPLRLVVGDEDSGLGTGQDHLLVMMRLLALCRRQRPHAEDKGTRHGVFMLDAESGYCIGVVPWSDPETGHGLITADRVIQGEQLEDVTHAF